MSNKIEIKGSGYIELLDHMGSDITVANAARISYMKETKEFSDKDEKLIKFLAEHGHTSPFRSVMFQLKWEIPEFLARQIYKHIVGISYTCDGPGFKDTQFNEISGRYVELEEKFWKTDQFRKQGSKNKQVGEEPFGYSENEVLKTQYEEHVLRSYGVYKALITQGVCREQARAVLPVGFITSFIMTPSLQACVHLIKLRSHEGAQKEVQLYSDALRQLIEPICPISVRELLK